MPLSLLILLGAVVAVGVVSAKSKPGLSRKRTTAISIKHAALMVSKKKKTFAERLDEYLRAYLVLSETIASQAKENTFKFSIELSRSMYAAGTYGRKHGPKNPGLLYSAVPWFLTGGQHVEALYGRELWSQQPAIAMLRAQDLLNQAIEVAQYLEEWGVPIKLGAEENGPTVGEMVEDYAQDAAVTYLAGAIPGGAIVLAIAELGGFGWTNGSGRREIPKGAEIPNDRLNAVGGAEDLIAYAYAHPAPASAYPDGKLPT